MTPTERLFARWAMDAAQALCVGLDHFYITVEFKKLKGNGMAIAQVWPYQQAKLTIDPRILADDYEARLYLAHELGHLMCNALATNGANPDDVEVLCDRIAVLAVGRVPAPPKAESIIDAR